jgi:hypothetical protein
MEAAQKTLRQQTASTCRCGSAPVREGTVTLSGIVTYPRGFRDVLRQRRERDQLNTAAKGRICTSPDTTLFAALSLQPSL